MKSNENDAGKKRYSTPELTVLGTIYGTPWKGAVWGQDQRSVPGAEPPADMPPPVAAQDVE